VGQSEDVHAGDDSDAVEVAANCSSVSSVSCEADEEEESLLEELLEEELEIDVIDVLVSPLELPWV